MPNQPKPPKWRNSPAKDILRQEILDGKVKDYMMPQEVWLRHPEYQLYKLRNFGPNLRRLQAELNTNDANAASDMAALQRDRLIHPISLVTPGGYPRWDGSDAQRLLKLDVEHGLTSTKTPMQLRESREEYKAFPLKVFRDHIQQEIRSEREKSYWLNRQKKKNKR